MPELRDVIGWDIGGAHVKACLMQHGRVVDVAQWPCPLWQGLNHLEHTLRQVQARWPQSKAAAHAITMTGEMTDLFEDREDGVQRIAALMASTLAAPESPGTLHVYAGDAGWCRTGDVGARWDRIASANWLATASHAARSLDEGVLIDIGSTTTDLIAFRAGRVLGTSRSDSDRLASGELVYQGVVRTPLCALAPRIEFQRREINVMNEFFAATADVYRLTGELTPVHDQQPSADNAPKDLPATRRRLARMIGLDARDASIDEWLAFAQAWRAKHVAELGGQLQRVIDMHRLSAHAVAVSAGCGEFLVADVMTQASAHLKLLHYGRDVARLTEPAAEIGSVPGADAVAAWAQVCAPAVAVAALFDREQR